MIRRFLAHLLVSAGVAGAALAAYHVRVVAPLQRVGVIDVAEVWQVKEREYADLVARAGAADGEREQAMAVARAFAGRLPAALEELARECRCLVLARSALAAPAPGTPDLTPALKRKLELAEARP